MEAEKIISKLNFIDGNGIEMLREILGSERTPDDYKMRLLETLASAAELGLGDGTVSIRRMHPEYDREKSNLYFIGANYAMMDDPEGQLGILATDRDEPNMMFYGVFEKLRGAMDNNLAVRAANEVKDDLGGSILDFKDTKEVLNFLLEQHEQQLADAIRSLGKSVQETENELSDSVYQQLTYLMALKYLNERENTLTRRIAASMESTAARLGERIAAMKNGIRNLKSGILNSMEEMAADIGRRKSAAMDTVRSGVNSMLISAFGKLDWLKNCAENGVYELGKAADKVKNSMGEYRAEARENLGETLNHAVSGMKERVDGLSTRTGKLAEHSQAAYEARVMAKNYREGLREAVKTGQPLSEVRSGNPTLAYGFLAGRLYAAQNKMSSVSAVLQSAMTSIEKTFLREQEAELGTGADRESGEIERE